MNYQVEQMRNAIRRYRDDTRRNEERLRNIWDWYKPEVAEREEATIRGEMRNERIEAENALIEAIQAATQRISSWATLDGNMLTADVRLLDVGVTPEQFAALVAKHATNYTMLDALKKYGEKQNAAAAEAARASGEVALATPFDLASIPDPTAMAETWKRLYERACGMLDAIAGVGKFSDAISRNLMLNTLDQQLERFGDELAM